MRDRSAEKMQALRNVVSSIAGGVRGAMTSLSAAQRQAAANAAKASMEENQAKITQSAAELIAHTSRFIPQVI